jgi:hypothetical protein
VAEGRVLLRGDDIIHGAPLPLDHQRVSIDCVMDSCHDYLLPYSTDDATCLVDLIGIPIKWPTTLVQMAEQVFSYLLCIKLFSIDLCF